MSADKGCHRAVEVALDAGLPLKIAGKMREPARAGLLRDLRAPHLGGGIEYLGETSHAKKVALLQNARATLFPIEWEEPFGLVMIESMACGTPVIATRGAPCPSDRARPLRDRGRRLPRDGDVLPLADKLDPPSAGARSRRTSRRSAWWPTTWRLTPPCSREPPARTGVNAHVGWTGLALARIGLIALLAASCGGGPEAEPAGVLVVADEDDLFVVGANGSGRRALVEASGTQFDADWSPDGARRLPRLVAGVNVDDEISVVAPDGSGSGEPDAESGQRLVAGLVARRQADRLCLRPRG